MGTLHAGRRAALRERLAVEAGSAPLIVTDLANVRYLSGFTGSNAIVVVGATPDDDLIATDGRYVDQVAQECEDLPVLIDRATLSGLLAVLPAGRVCVEQGLSVAARDAMAAQRGAPTVIAPIIEELRSLKDAEELAHLTRACRITSQAFEAIAQEIRVGMTERSVARRLEQLFGDFGAEDRAFPSIVASGPHSAIPHHRADTTALGEGDLVVIDAGARVNGYHADMTRTWVVGAEPDPWQVQIHDLVREAQAAAVAAVEPGLSASSIDAAARDVLRAGGHEEHFTHGLGHGVGLQIHEAPSVGARATGTIHTSMAFTVEPGVYVPGRGGVRIEDTLVVKDAGSSALTEGTRDLRVVGV